MGQVILREYRPRPPESFHSSEFYEMYLQEEAERHRKMGATRKWLVYLIGIPVTAMNVLFGLVRMVTEFGDVSPWLNNFILAMLIGYIYSDIWAASKHDYYLMKRYVVTLLDFRERNRF